MLESIQQAWSHFLGILIVLGLLLGPAGIIGLLIIILLCCRVNPEFIYPLLGLMEHYNRDSNQHIDIKCADTKISNECNLPYSGEIQYGLDGHGGWNPTKIGNKNVKYGLDGHGNWRPVEIGGERIEYGLDGHGGWNPTKIGGKNIKYGLDGHGNWRNKGIE